MSVTTSYNYLENGTQMKSGSTSYTFYGWDNWGWEIEFPTDITGVLSIDFSTLPGTIRNSTSAGAGRLNFYVYDHEDNLISTTQSNAVGNNSSINTSTLSAITLTGQTVSKIQITGPTNTGPNLVMSSIDNSSTFNITTEQGIEGTVYTHLIDLTWPSLSGASTYNITYTENGGSEIEIINGTTELSAEITELNPGTTYVFSLYTDVDTVTASRTATLVTPVISEASVDAMMGRISNDLRVITDLAVSELEGNFRDVLTTGEIVQTDEREMTFVHDSETYNLSEIKKNLLTPFDANSGSSQTFSVTLPDTTTHVLTYDNTLDQVIYDSESYGMDSYFKLGNYKVYVRDL